MSRTSKRANNARKLNGSVLPRVNHLWASLVLGMNMNTGTGIDLTSNSGRFGVELKFMKREEGYNKSNWTVEESQLGYNRNGMECFWGVGCYELSRPLLEIKGLGVDEIEDFIVSRELYLVQWDWINRFPPSDTSGQTYISEWDSTLRYPKFGELPSVRRSYDVNKGLVHLTDGVDGRKFRIGANTNAPF